MNNQRVIAIDESGNFETKESHCRFIGGCVFRGACDLEERSISGMLKHTAERITEKYKGKLQGRRFVFPYSFHMSQMTVFASDGTESPLLDNELKRIIRRTILEEVKDYLSKRRSRYQIFALVVPFQNTVGYESSKETNSFILTDFRTPGVLYERLVTGLIHNFTFYSLEPGIKKNIFKIASRTPILHRSETSAELFQKLKGIHRISVDGGNNIHLTQTDINTFKASLSEKMYEGSEINRLAVKDIELDCRSVDYKGKKNGEQRISPFFYLADIICYYLQRLFYGEKGNQYYEDFKVDSETLERVKVECVVPAFFWVYEETDSLFKKAVEYYAEGNLVECFSALYDMENAENSRCTSYYKSYWEKKLLALLEQEYIWNRISEFELRFSEMLFCIEEIYMHRRTEYLKGDFMLGHLRTVMEQGGYKITDRQKYKMWDIAMQLHNHHGSVENSKKCFVEMIKFSGEASADELSYSINRAAQIFFNSFDYEPIILLYDFMLEEADEIRTSYQRQRELTNQLIYEVFGEKSDMTEAPAGKFDWIGKMLSSQGQAYAFLKQYEKAEECFLRALKEFTREGDKIQSLGYLLHVFIEAGKKDAYLEYGPRVFGAEDIKTQMDNLIKTGLTRASSRYNLYIWLKAAYKFGFICDRRSRKALEKVISEIHAIDAENPALLQTHPWELNAKYLYLLCSTPALKMETEMEYFRKKSTDPWEKDEETVTLIKDCIELLYENDANTKQGILDRIGEHCAGLEGWKFYGQTEDREAWLAQKITYTYY